MITLYHHGSSVCAAKVRLVLAEKSVPWNGIYVDILRGDQFDPGYVKLNPKAVVPTLVHDGKVIVESTVICEYLDEVFPAPSLKPAAPEQRAAMRLWTKTVDEYLHPACAELTFASCHRYIIGRLPPEKLNEFLESTPPISVTADWHARKKEIVRQGMAAPRVDRTFQLYDSYLQKMEDTLAEQAWLAGDTLSLADIAMAPYVNRLDMLGMSEMWVGSRPRLTEWFERMKSRPSFKPSLLDMCAPDLTNDLKTFGTRSWPDVMALSVLVTATHAGAQTATPPEGSAVSFALTAADGSAVTERTYRGKWLVVYFGYTFCPDVCPTTLMEIAGTLEKLGPRADMVRGLFVTVDPKRDTPEILSAYIKSFDPRIIGLTGVLAQIAVAAKSFNVFYERRDTDDGGYVYDHTTLVYLVDPDGRFVRALAGNADAQQIADALVAAMAAMR